MAIPAASGAYAQMIKAHEFAGRFYPQNHNDLARAINSFLADNPAQDVDGRVTGIIVPHAAYMYSGRVAACSYNAVKGADIDTVILLGPTHRYPFRGIAVWPQGTFTTPLGKIDVDHKIAADFMGLEFVSPQTRYFSGEHSLEVQIPFLQTLLPGAKIVPFLFGEVTYDQLSAFARRLDEVTRRRKTLIVVSSDLSHYHPYEEASRIDARTLEYISRRDYSGLWTSLQLDERRACGIRGLIAFLMYTAERGDEIKILKYANSGDTGGDKSSVVGYVSAAAYSRQTTSLKEEHTMSGFEFTDEVKKTLLAIARITLENHLAGKPVPEFEQGPPVLYEKRGAFVTLKKHGELRGCIGRIVADMPLYKVVSDFAIHAAVEDPRFNPVHYEELKDIEIEISVLTPFEEIASLDEIEVGTHGLMIRKGYRSGLLLPQVPVEYGWDRDTFLEHLCYKAQMPADAYKDDGVTIYKFSAVVFSESDVK